MMKLNLQRFADDDPPADKYLIVENTFVSLNGTKTELKRNMEIVRGVNGAIIGVKGEGEEIELSDDLIAALTLSGAIVKVETPEAEAGE